MSEAPPSPNNPDRIPLSHQDDTPKGGFARNVLAPLFLIVACPPSVGVLWYTCAHLDGSLGRFVSMVLEMGPIGAMTEIWAPIFFGTPTAWAIIGIFAVVQLIFMRVLPGARTEGPATPSGHVPIYKANGMLAFTVTMLTFFGCSQYGAGLYDLGIAYHNLGGILGALNIFSLVFCLFLYLKGRFAPSPGEHGVSGNFIFDYYWGTELYPRVAGFDLKQFTNCRFGMMAWPVLALSYAGAQAELHTLTYSMIVCVGLQLVYCAKFFWWEMGYMRSMDIQHDRAGFYICWGCLVWVPSLYTLPGMYLVEQPVDLDPMVAALIFGLGVLAIFTNYFADAQRQRVRATNGETTVWGKKPEILVANYTTRDGEAKQSLLLMSGWWGVSRHFHYVPEILGAFFWTVPALFVNITPYLYLIFLTILLVHRAYRDEQKCSRKYGEDWKTYCEKVPYKIIPGLI